jgi:uncharacterized protein YjiS (DUF1127 family)
MTAIATLWPSRSAFKGAQSFSASPYHPFRMLHKMVSRRRTRTQLGNLEDRMLKDIGLHRSEIEAIALNPNRQPIIPL